MKKILDSLPVIEGRNGFNISLMIKDNTLFSVTDYKVMKGEILKNLVPCVKLLYNGHVKLVYLTEQYRTVKEILPHTEESDVLYLLVDMLQCIKNICDNGFLVCDRLLLDMKYLYVDEKKMKIHLLYVPIEANTDSSDTLTENIISIIMEMLDNAALFDEERKKSLQQELLDEDISLDDFSRILEQKCRLSGKYTNKKVEENIPEENTLVLSSVNSVQPILFRIDKDNFIIGRGYEEVDGTIPDHKTIGRRHCKVIKKEDHYYIEDLNSKNGTYVNNRRLSANERIPLEKGDILKLADIVLKVEIHKKRIL